MAAENAERALQLVVALEGGYVDHPLDPGGPTRFGITRATLAAIRGRRVTAADVKALGETEARAIYRRLYWDAVRADDLPSGVDLAVFDCAVNSGPRRAALILQRALGLARDGTIGPQTLAAARKADPATLVRDFGRLRLGLLRRLPIFSAFGKGWRSRIDTVERAALSPPDFTLARPGAAPRLPSTGNSETRP